ncbi:hypothetical protein GMORB2_4807 [Geosmithia morbida]|uniref:DUF7704 domain-containing protein n=1 Tax=Geosmithia morbida TaxID=1094350 RepID=A0A9P4YLQ2_9HYPO|nr:uncharacterized protein GMORB2_4807 [Geosmithia morbida]KAF4119288.1 hypothetical protein GMORB2_4807 [Geosmithia morbida]
MMASTATAKVGSRLPFPYRLFFLVVEPLSALVGAYYSHFRQAEYLELLGSPPPSSSDDVAAATATATSVALSQLANMYLFFALNEALVLRSTTDMRVWTVVLTVLLLADLGHLYSLRELGPRVYYDVMSWNAADLGNVPWVYMGATMRLCFLLGVGMGSSSSGSSSNNNNNNNKKKQ